MGDRAGLLAEALVREYLTRHSLTTVLEAFNEQRPKGVRRRPLRRPAAPALRASCSEQAGDCLYKIILFAADGTLVN